MAKAGNSGRLFVILPPPFARMRSPCKPVSMWRSRVFGREKLTTTPIVFKGFPFWEMVGILRSYLGTSTPWRGLWECERGVMIIVGRDTLDEFSDSHADARSWIKSWIADVETATWRTPQDIKNNYATASFLADRIVIFNVKGNHYRVEVRIAYNTGIVVVHWVGTHAEYTKRMG